MPVAVEVQGATEVRRRGAVYMVVAVSAGAVEEETAGVVAA